MIDNLSGLFLFKEYKDFEDNLRELSSMDGESLFPVVKCIHLLMIARLVFLEISNDMFKDIKVNQFFSFKI